MILILLSNSWFEFLSTSISCSFLTNPGREKNLFRRNRQHKNTPSVTAVLYLCYFCYKVGVEHYGGRLDFTKVTI